MIVFEGTELRHETQAFFHHHHHHHRFIDISNTISENK